MVSKNEIKLIKSLQQKKYRNKHGLFIAEGIKTVNEYLNSDFKLYKLLATKSDLFSKYSDVIHLISESDLKKISTLKTPGEVLGIFYIKESGVADTYEGLTLVLDDIRDPGNLGTIIRMCDWFGVENLVCSPNTVDCYNPKVIQATMGSLARIHLVYEDLIFFLENTQKPIYGATVGGADVYKTEISNNAILIMGNEANGISAPVLSLVKNKIGIPRFGNIQETESLNVATATAILLSEFKRR